MNDNRKVAKDNTAQTEFWNSPAGEKWVTFEERLDGALSSVKERLLQRARVQTGERIIEIGCGTGDTALALARQAGPRGSVLAVDVSQPLLTRAGERITAIDADNITLLLSDAQTHEFDAASADLLASRFGVMFFADPVAAFTNMAKALKPGGRLVFVSWAAVDVNPWFKIPGDAAIARLGEPAPVPQFAPGPLAFQDIGYVTDILGKAGLSGITADEESIDLHFPCTLDEVTELLCNLGPASRLIKEKNGTPADVAAIASAVREQLAAMVVDDDVKVPARLNFFNAVRA